MRCHRFPVAATVGRGVLLIPLLAAICAPVLDAQAPPPAPICPELPWVTLAVPADDVLGIPHARLAEEGVLVGGQPAVEHLATLAWVGYRAILDLRPREEERGLDEPAAALAHGLAYHNLPVTLTSLDGALIDRFVATVATAERPLLVHCGSGNRAAGLYAAYLVKARGVPVAEALERGYALGLRQAELAERLAALLSSGP